MDCRATAGAVSRNDEWEAWLSSSRILGFAVLLVGLFVDFLKKPASLRSHRFACFGAELDLRSAVAPKSTKSPL